MKAAQVSLSVTPNTYNIDSLSGFKNRSESAVNLGDPELYISANWIKDETDCDLILISVDALYINSNSARVIYEFVEKEYKITKKQIVFNATHTHSAPSISNDIFGVEDLNYREIVQNKIIEAIRLASTNLKPMSLKMHVLKLPNDLVVNRRLHVRDFKTLFFKRNTLMAPDYDKEYDSNCRIITIGVSSGVFFNFSCHPVFNRSNRMSSDFPGDIRIRLSRNFQNPVFFQGFSGDVRPNSVVKSVKYDNLKSIIKTLIYGVSFIPSSKVFYNRFCDAMASAISTKQFNGQVLSGIFRFKLFHVELCSDSGNTRKNIECKLIYLDSLLLVSIPAEVNSKYVNILSSEHRGVVIMPMGYSEGVIGYLPHWSEVDNGGYEVDSYANYGWDSKISKMSLKHFELILLNKVSELIHD